MKGKEAKRKAEADDDGLPLGQTQPRKKKILVGVHRHLFYPSRSGDPDTLLEGIGKLDSTDAIAREALYSGHRDTIQRLFTCSANICTTVPGFFDDPSHCRNHFEYLAGMSLQKNVEEELEIQMGHVKKVVKVWCRTEGAKKRMESADLLSKELQGSKVPQYVCHLRELTLVWYKKLGGFIRFPGEEEKGGPHIVCHETTVGLRFDIHSEQKKVLGNLSFPTALATFFHIVFIGQLKYPADNEAVAILLQRRLAKIDEEGE